MQLLAVLQDAQQKQELDAKVTQTQVGQTVRTGTFYAVYW